MSQIVDFISMLPLLEAAFYGVVENVLFDFYHGRSI